jgi:hypothetical protein
MDNKQFAFWQRWLLVVSVIVVVFGLFIAFLNQTSLFDLFNRGVDPAFWGTGAVPVEARRFQRWAYGVLGATMAGWGMTFLYVTRQAFRRGERWAWNAVLVGILLWFAVDEYISLASGVYFNAAFNVVILAMVGLPLIFTRRHFG